MADAGEKTEDPTSKRLNEARSNGQVSKSQDLTAAVAILAGVLAFAAIGGRSVDRASLFMRDMLDTRAAADDPVTTRSVLGEVARAMATIGDLVWPYALLGCAVAGLTVYLQIGWLFTLKPLKPKLTKLNPVNGLKRIFGMKGQVKTLLSLAKIAAAIAVAWVIIAARAPRFVVLPRLDAVTGSTLVAHTAFEIAIALALILLILGLIDLMYQRWQHKHDLKMSKSEVKDERKQLIGDMSAKRRRYQMYADIVRNQVAKATGDADVVVTNPTHFAVALKYDQERMDAPRVTAKGADLVALRIRDIAKARGIPVIERPPLARALYAAVPVGGDIRPEHYESVAEVLAYVYRIDRGRRERQAAAGSAAA